MPKIICKQCGASGSSKNPWTRSIFMDNLLEAGFSQRFKFNVDRTDPEYPVINLGLKYIAGPKASDYESVVQALKYIHHYVNLVPAEQLACNHGEKGWYVDGECTC